MFVDYGNESCVANDPNDIPWKLNNKDIAQHAKKLFKSIQKPRTKENMRAYLKELITLQIETYESGVFSVLKVPQIKEDSLETFLDLLYDGFWAMQGKKVSHSINVKGSKGGNRKNIAATTTLLLQIEDLVAQLKKEVMLSNCTSEVGV